MKKDRNRKRLLMKAGIFLLLLITLGSSGVFVKRAEAAATWTARVPKKYTGWKTDRKINKKRYYKKGKYVTGLKKIDSKYCVFNSKGYLVTSDKYKGGKTWYYLSKYHVVLGYQKNGVWYNPDKSRMSSDDAYYFETKMRAREILKSITRNGMSKARKLRAAFDWVMAKYYIMKRAQVLEGNWIPLYANDHFLGNGGTCVSDAAALAFLADAIGFSKVYVCLDASPYNPNSHAWTEINGLVYDPLFAQAKSYSKYYGCTYGTYGLYAVNKTRVQ